jgi:hypothetical protein
MRLKTSLAFKKETLRKLKREAKRQQRSVSFIVNAWVDERFDGAPKKPEPAAVT